MYLQTYVDKVVQLGAAALIHVPTAPMALVHQCPQFLRSFRIGLITDTFER